MRRSRFSSPFSRWRPVNEHSGRRIAAFIAIAFSWAWVWWVLPILLLGNDLGSPIAEMTTFFGTCAPAVAAWTIWWRTSSAREAWRKLGRCLIPSGPWIAWIAPALAIFAVARVASWSQQLWGDPVPASPSLWLILPQLLVMLVAGGGQEEIGWRGWLHPAVRARTGRWQTPFIVGIIWFCWHLPLWWIPGSIQTYVPRLAFAMMLIGLSLLLTQTLEATRGRPAVAIWLHALNNLAAAWLVFITPEDGAMQLGAWVMGIGYLIIGAATMMLRPARKGSSYLNA